jgi:hypothetical protein
MSTAPNVFDMNAPPAALAQAQADALNAAAEAVQAQQAHSGSTSPSLQDPTVMTVLANLANSQQNLQNIMQGFFTSAPTPPRTGATFGNNIATTAYDINKPGTLGVTPANQVRHIASLEYAQSTAQYPVTDWLKAVEQSCKFHRVDFPAAYAGSYLTKEAGNIYNAAFHDRDPYSITWEEFRAWLLASTLHDRLADQKLLDDVAALRQGNMSIKEYVEVASKLYGRKSNHPMLDSYPEHFWRETFMRGLNHEIKSRLHIVDPSVTLASITAEALSIGMPLEAAGIIRQAATNPSIQQPFRGNGFRGYGSFRGRGRGGGWGDQRAGQRGQINALSAQLPPTQAGLDTKRAMEIQLSSLAKLPTAPPTINEQTLAIWERSYLDKDARRAARTARGACGFCGLRGHDNFSCTQSPAGRGARGLNTLWYEGAGAGNEYFDINTGSPNASGLPS